MIELHVHSCYSDGELLPEKIVQYLAERRFQKISITDHDKVAPTIDTASLKAKDLGMEFINGIEITTDYKGITIHLLGYDFNLNRLNGIEELKTYLNLISKFYQDAGKEICKLTQKSPTSLKGKDGKRYELSFSESELKEIGQNVSTHTGLIGILINRKLKEFTGERVSPYETMTLFLRQTEIIKKKYEHFIKKHDIKFGERTTSIYYKKPKPIDVKKAIEFILESNGVPVIAHPGEQHLEEKQLCDLKAMGVKGLEVYSPKNRNVQEYKRIANKLRLIKTGGTDWHGPESMANIKPGYYTKEKKIPNFCWDEIKKAKLNISAEGF